ncbi:AMMECR1-like protein [Psilocybe cubensis]|uniref:AMMECR1 domain-containing protein n=2 Tax=Psilocybe cubensis TaxID=181762 RepID=A0A8H8CJR7_PSICU|nr:AMMECR1-like protein [Psilocybe cubensis]KAH9482465.1 AMMECR1-like protein [Psilocybe cubensis]
MSLDPAKPVAHDTPQACTREHCLHAFDALYCSLTDAEPIPPRFPDEKYPLFVTWDIKQRGEWHLRGCIGNFEPMPIHDGLAEYALVSAFRDTRFRKIDRSELERLRCSVSLLTDFERGDTYLDWTIGVHGIRISFPHPSLLQPSSEAPSPLSSSGSLPRVSSKQTFSATYLPEVIPEQGWDKIEAIDSAIEKAGWRHRITEDLRRSIKLVRYQSSQCSVTWDQYIQWRHEMTH